MNNNSKNPAVRAAAAIIAILFSAILISGMIYALILLLIQIKLALGGLL